MRARQCILQWRDGNLTLCVTSTFDRAIEQTATATVAANEAEHPLNEEPNMNRLSSTDDKQCTLVWCVGILKYTSSQGIASQALNIFTHDLPDCDEHLFVQSPHPNDLTFHPFPGLPIELRLKIWKATFVGRRIVDLDTLIRECVPFRDTIPGNHPRTFPTARILIACFVNQESRSYAFETFTIYDINGTACNVCPDITRKVCLSPVHDLFSASFDQVLDREFPYHTDGNAQKDGILREIKKLVIPYNLQNLPFWLGNSDHMTSCSCHSCKSKTALSLKLCNIKVIQISPGEETNAHLGDLQKVLENIFPHRNMDLVDTRNTSTSASIKHIPEGRVRVIYTSTTETADSSMEW